MKIIKSIKTTAILAVLAIAGCANLQNKYTQATGQVSQDLSLTHAGLLDVSHKVSGTPIQGEVDSIDLVVSDAISKAPILEQGAADDVAAHQYIDKLVADFWSVRQHHLFAAIVASVIALALFVVLCSILMNTSGPVGMIATIVIHTMTGGLSLLVKHAKSNLIPKA